MKRAVLDADRKEAMLQQFAEQLSTLRQERGLSQGKLAKLSGIDRTTICHYEAGRRHPGLFAAAALDTALGAGGKLVEAAGYVVVVAKRADSEAVGGADSGAVGGADSEAVGGADSEAVGGADSGAVGGKE